MRRLALAALAAGLLALASFGVAYAGGVAPRDPRLPLVGCIHGEMGVLRAMDAGAPLSCPGLP
ncbi:MAG: hypothetical protein Q8P22_00130 [Chloroflexota bacterium]|nr:hypothetical protein [Chloroflexota bacterium]